MAEFQHFMTVVHSLYRAHLVFCYVLHKCMSLLCVYHIFIQPSVDELKLLPTVGSFECCIENEDA